MFCHSSLVSSKTIVRRTDMDYRVGFLCHVCWEYFIFCRVEVLRFRICIDFVVLVKSILEYRDSGNFNDVFNNFHMRYRFDVYVVGEIEVVLTWSPLFHKVRPQDFQVIVTVRSFGFINLYVVDALPMLLQRFGVTAVHALIVVADLLLFCPGCFNVDFVAHFLFFEEAWIAAS